jgi:hypothetical protein
MEPVDEWGNRSGREHEPVMLSLGIDIGQQRDPTAIALLKGSEQNGIVSLECRFLERLPLDTSYPTVARRVAEIERNAIQTARQRVFDRTGYAYPDIYLTTYIDATGVGKPIVDLLAEHKVKVMPCYFTHGDRRTEDTSDTHPRITIGKAYLVARLQMLLQNGRIRLSRSHPDAVAMRNELLNYEIKVDQNANDRYGACRTGTHDDLVTALGLAAQVDPPYDVVRQSRALADYLRNQ